jgi:hypothetical protein
MIAVAPQELDDPDEGGSATHVRLGVHGLAVPGWIGPNSLQPAAVPAPLQQLVQPRRGPGLAAGRAAAPLPARRLQPA